jgi:hypothetical protein
VKKPQPIFAVEKLRVEREAVLLHNANGNVERGFVVPTIAAAAGARLAFIAPVGQHRAVRYAGVVQW